MKSDLLAWVSLLIIVSNLYLLSSSRLTSLTKGVAVQGILLAALSLLLAGHSASYHLIFLTILSIGVKGILIPFYLSKLIREVKELRDANPVIGYSLSMFIGVVISCFAFYILQKAPFVHAFVSVFHGASAISTAGIGLFLIITSRNVIRQIIGFLVFENASFIFGLSIAIYQPLFVEMGILLDTFAGVLIMVIAARRILTVHQSISVRSLERLSK